MIVREYDSDGLPRARPIAKVCARLQVEAERCGAEEDRIWFYELRARGHTVPSGDDPAFIELASFFETVGMPETHS
jgi:hypothetical protein